MQHPKILVFAGSIRSGSINAGLAALFVKELALTDVPVTRISLADYPMPIYDGDLEKQEGVPPQAVQLAQMMAAHHGVLIVTPEYNASLPPLLKNALDWVSRPGARLANGASPYADRVFAVAAASNGQYGGIRALLHLRPVLEVGLGALVIPEQMAVPRASQVFAADGHFVDAALEERMKKMVKRLVREAARYAV